MTEAELAEVLEKKALRAAQFAEENAETEYWVSVTIPVRGYARAVEMFTAVVDAVNPINSAYEAEIEDDNSYSAYVLDAVGGAVY
jgi:hypothetical protein